MAIYRASDSINGKLCKAFATIDGNVEQLFYIKIFEANIEKTKSEVPVLGDLWMQHKAGGLSGSGSMTIRAGSPIFKKLISSYAETHIDTYFTLTIINDDPGSRRGIQSVTLLDVNMNGCNVTKMDVETDVLEEDYEFTFSGVKSIREYNSSVD